MATMLRESNSSEKHLNAGRRLVRLSKEVPGCEQFGAGITPALVILGDKVEQTEIKTINREDALDDVKLKERQLNNGIKTVYERCGQYDRENIGAAVVMKLFPDGKYTGITSADRASKADMVDQIGTKAEAFGADHPLTAQIAVLKTLCTALREALAQYAAAQHSVKIASAEEEIARAEVRKVYEANYLDARKTLGRDIAETIFPDLATTKETTKKSQEQSQSAAKEIAVEKS